MNGALQTIPLSIKSWEVKRLNGNSLFGDDNKIVVFSNSLSINKAKENLLSSSKFVKGSSHKTILGSPNSDATKPIFF